MKNHELAFILFLQIFFLSITLNLSALTSMSIQPVDPTYKSKSRYQVGFNSQTIYYKGMVHEYVYSTKTNAKMSEIKWDYQPLILTGVSINAQLFEIFTAKFGYWQGLNKKLGSVEDFDWLTQGDYYSHHDCRLDYARYFDGNAGINFIRGNRLKLNFSIGIQYSNTKTHSLDGYLRYPNKPETQVYGEGISYEQQIFIPYLGLQTSFFIANPGITLSAYSTITIKGKIDSIDKHLQRYELINGIIHKELDFYDSMSNCIETSIGTSIGYSISNEIALAFGCGYNKLWERSGDTYTYLPLTNERTVTSHGGAGTAYSGYYLTFEIRTGFSLGKSEY